MTPRHVATVFGLALTLGVSSVQGSLQSRVIFDGVDRILIQWESQPGESYFLQTTTNLAESWHNLQTQPVQLMATTNTLSHELTITNQSQFFRVAWLDTLGPRLAPDYPRYEGIAVPRDSVLKAQLVDESGVDTNSIQLQVNSQPPIAFSDSRLSWTNQTLTYQPAAGENLGAYGQTMTVTVTATDLAGNRSTNVWPFQLELETILSTNILVLGGLQPGMAQSASSSANLTLVSRNGALFVYRYSGASSGLRQGMHLVDATPGQEYARTVLVFSEDSTSQTVAVWTQRAALADLVEEGSVSTRTVHVNPPGNLGPHLELDVGADLDFAYNRPLQVTLYEWKEGENYIRVELTSRSQLDLQAKAGFAANFRNLSLTEFEAYAEGLAELQFELYAEGNYQKHFDSEIALITPIYARYVIMVGAVPVAVKTKLELDLTCDVDLQATGYFRNGLTAKIHSLGTQVGRPVA